MRGREVDCTIVLIFRDSLLFPAVLVCLVSKHQHSSNTSNERRPVHQRSLPTSSKRMDSARNIVSVLSENSSANGSATFVVTALWLLRKQWSQALAVLSAGALQLATIKSRSQVRRLVIHLLRRCAIIFLRAEPVPLLCDGASSR